MTKSVFSDAYAVLLEAIIAARKEVGLTQVELAGRLGKPQPFISYVERGERRLDVIEFCAWANAMGIPAETLFARVLQGLPDDLPI